MEPVDVLAVGAHPDDVELGIGGLMHKLTHRGYRAAILDLTRGEMSTRGTVEERAEEGQRAAAVLGVAQRENAGLPDGAVAHTDEMRRQIIPYLRGFRPRVLLAPMRGDRHPDHTAAHYLVSDAAYFAGLAKIETGQEPYRPERVYYYQPYFEETVGAALIADISDHFEAKIASLKAHASQFFNPEYGGRPTVIASQEFWESIEVRARYWGNRIQCRYGEPLCSDRPVGVDLPPGLEDRL